jgi:hypothetical protein
MSFHLALPLCGLGLAAPADAQFMDCMAEGYLDAFADAPTAEGLACLELFRFEVPTPDGPRFIRGIADAGADWAIPSDMVAEAERGARLAGLGFGGLGTFRVDNITLLILDDVHATADLTGEDPADPDAPRGVLGVALSAPDLPPGARPECLITLYGLAPGATDGSLATTVAHEIFHCVQGATYAGPKYDSYGSGGAWWIEGAAEAFAAAVVPESAAYTDRSADFDAAVEARVALNEMEHQAVHFFYWLMGARGGLAALMPFQDAMASSGGAAAQQAAMRGALSGEEWARFAQAYADGTIRHPQGGGLGSVAPEGTVLTIEEAGRFDLPTDPFTLTLGRADFGCGLWGTTARPPAPEMTWTTSTDWGDLPAEVDTRDGADTAWRLVALPRDSGDGGLTVERRAGCTPCLGSTEIDACLVGRWELSGGGPEEWMRAQGLTMRTGFDGPRQITLRADGVFATGAFGVTASDSQGDVTVEGEGQVSAAAGSWSVAEGVLNTCISAGGGMAGEVTVTTPETSGTMPTGAPGGGSLSVRYSCSAGELVTTLPMGGGLPDMVTSYRRISD